MNDEQRKAEVAFLDEVMANSLTMNDQDAVITLAKVAADKWPLVLAEMSEKFLDDPERAFELLSQGSVLLAEALGVVVELLESEEDLQLFLERLNGQNL